MKLRVAVTGGSGRIGRALVRELFSRGHDVINLDRMPDEQSEARSVLADLGRREDVEPALRAVDAVCHLGEIPSAHGTIAPEEVFSQNVRAGSVVMQTAADLKLRRAIYTSSCQAYGLWDHPRGAPKFLPMDETHPLSPHNAYALGKAAMERYARLVAEQHGLSVAAFRLPWVASDEYSDAWTQSLRREPDETDGFATYCHVSDVVRAYALALENPRPGFEVYHFSAKEILSLYPLAERLARHHPDYPKLPADWPAFKSPLITDKARDHFGWEPCWNFLDFYRARFGEPSACFSDR